MPQFCILLAQTLHTFSKSSPSKSKFSNFPMLALKFTKFLKSFFKQKSVFLQSLNLFSVSWEIILLYFFSWNFLCYWQKRHIKVQFSDFRLFTWKLTKLLFSLNFTPPFFVTYNSSEIFCLRHYMVLIKMPHQCTTFSEFERSNESWPNSSCHFRNQKVRIYSNLSSLFSVMKDNS